MLGNPHVDWAYGQFGYIIHFSAILPIMVRRQRDDHEFKKSGGG
jgi:hypothetical protein